MCNRVFQSMSGRRNKSLKDKPNRAQEVGMMCLVGGVGYMRGHGLGCSTEKVSLEERSKVRLKDRKE